MDPSSNHVRSAIEALIAAEDAAWLAGDAAAFSAATTPDVVFTNVIGMFSVGNGAFEAQHRAIFATIYKGSRVKQTIEHIAFPTPDVAIVDTVAEVTGFAGLPHGIEATDGVLRTRLEQVLVRDAGSWRIAAFHNVVLNAAAIAAATAARSS